MDPIPEDAALRGRRKGKKHWNPILPTAEVLAVEVYGAPHRVTFTRMPVDNQRIAVYAGEGFIIRATLQATRRGRQLVVSCHHETDWPHYFLMIGLAAALAPAHVRWTMPLATLAEVNGRVGGRTMTLEQIIPED